MKNFYLFLLIATLNILRGVSQPVEQYGKLQVIGTQLSDSAGNPVVIRGMSYGWHNWWPRFYNEKSVDWLVNDWKVDAVRAAMGVETSGAYLSDSANAVDLIKNVINGAINSGIYVIIDWHSHNINTSEAITFFSYMARTYGHLPNVIYEIFNEPDDETWAEVKAYSISLIDTIRKIDPDNIILVGSPNWDQDLHLVAADPIKGYSNIMYTMHFYAATHGKWLRDRCDDAIADTIPIFVSESAGSESTGDGTIDKEAWNDYIQWMEQNQLSWFCWSISDKNETSAVLNVSASDTGNWKITDLKESGQQCRNLFKKFNSSYEPARIFNAMAKGRRGEDLVIGVIGGSITQGYAASTTNNRWANLMADWWEAKFPSSNVRLVNAGWGGTGSDIGAHRAYDDLFKENPDFIVIEFSVNDVEGELATKMMEGLVQQAILHESAPGIMLLLLKQENGQTAQSSHKLVGKHYNVPMVNYADLIDDQLVKDGLTIGDIYVDGVHPNDLGMTYIADFIKEQLDTLYKILPADDELPPVNTDLGARLIGDIFSKTYQFFPDNLIPLNNNGWDAASIGWTNSNPGDQIDFKLRGNSISLIFAQNDDGNRGKAEVWVDNGPKTIIDCWMNENWGTRYAYSLVDEDLDDTYHTLHIKTLNESSTSGNYIHIERIMVAGNIGGVMPIAQTSSKQKGVVNNKTFFDGTDSYVPDGSDILSYEWSISEKPTGSIATIENALDSISSFSPDIEGVYTISLIVKTLISESIPANKTFLVNAANSVPVAIAGNDTMSVINRRFPLDGSGSYDDDGDQLLYKWALESKPEGSGAYILVVDIAETQLRIDAEGEYVVSLVVNDSIVDSDTSYRTITVDENYSGLNLYSSGNSTVVYPNPVSHNLNIDFFLDQTESVKFSLYSQSSQLLIEYQFPNAVFGINKYSIPVSNILEIPGLYFIKLETNGNSTILPFTYIIN